MDKELSYEFVRGYVQCFRDSASQELKVASTTDVKKASFIRGQMDACQCILKNMGVWN